MNNSYGKRRTSVDIGRKRLLFLCSTNKSIALQSFQLGIHKTELQIFAQETMVALNNIHILHESKGPDRHVRVKILKHEAE